MLSVSVYALMVFKFLQKSFSLPYISINFLFASLILLPNFENASWNPPQNSFFCDLTMFFNANLSLAAEKMRKN